MGKPKTARDRRIAGAMKKIEASLQKKAKEKFAESNRMSKLMQAAHQPLIDFYKSVYGRNNASLRKYTTELVRQAKRTASEERLFPRHHMDSHHLLTATAADASHLRYPAEWRVIFPPYESVRLPVPVISGDAEYRYYSSRPTADGSVLGGALIVDDGKTGSARLWQGAGISFHSDDSGWTGVTLQFLPEGYVTMISAFGFALCEISLEMSVFDITSGLPAPLSTNKLEYGPPRPAPGTIEVDVFRTAPTYAPRYVDCGFDRKPNTDYGAYASLNCFLSFQPFNDSKYDFAVCEQTVSLHHFTITSFKT